MISLGLKAKLADYETVSDMLSEKEREEMRTLAGSKAIRDEFRLLRKQSLHYERRSLDQFIRFLTAMSRLSSTQPLRRTLVEYRQVKL